MLVTFRLKPGRDDDLIDMMNSFSGGDRSYYIRKLLREGPANSVATHPALKIKPREGKIDEIVEPDLEKSLDSWI